MNDKLRPPTRTVEAVTDHASRGVGKAYPPETREQVMATVDHHPGELNSHHTLHLQQLRKYPSRRTIQRWIQRRNDLGHVRPFQRTGNNRALREITGDSLINLAIFRAVSPKAQLAEVKAFLFTRNQNNNFNPYSDSQILRAEVKLDLTRKAASTTAAKAYLPRNLQLRYMYFNCNYPLGIADIQTDDIIDSNEAGFFLESSNRGFGKTIRGDRCDEEGAYDKCSEKMTVLCGICGDRHNPMRWIETWTGEGTTIIILQVHFTNL